MMRSITLRAVPCLCAGLILALLWPTAPARAGRFLDKQASYKRVRAALSARLPAVRRAFEKVGAAWPPRGIYLRAFKSEAAIELWAAPKDPAKRWVHVRDFSVCESSGVIGPKRQVGDLQVPEGFYHIDRFNPWSRYHLSLGINYPNRVDRRRSRTIGRHPGGDIFIHGDCVTIGCMPITDGPMEELYIAAIVARDEGQRRIPVHIFPCRFGTRRCEQILAPARRADAALGSYWGELARIAERFRQDGRPPRVVDQADGTYRLLKQKRSGSATQAAPSGR